MQPKERLGTDGLATYIVSLTDFRHQHRNNLKGAVHVYEAAREQQGNELRKSKWNSCRAVMEP